MAKLTRRDFTAGMLLIGASGPAFGSQENANSWHAGPSVPIVAQEIYPAVLGRNIYLAGGFTIDEESGAFAISSRAFVWGAGGTNPVTGEFITGAAHGAWFDISPLPEPRHHPNLVGHAGAIHAIGGFRAGGGGAWNMLNAHTRIEPAANTWEERRPMPRVYAETCVVNLAGSIHVATGRQPRGSANANWNDHGDAGVHYVYDADEDRWRQAAPNPYPRNSAAGAVLNGKFHVVGGRRVNDGNATQHEAYDPDSDSWQTLAPLPQGQGGLAAATANGKLYAFGGEWFEDGGGVYPNVWVYDPDTDQWSAGPVMRTPRHGLGGVTVDGRIYAIGGATRAGGNGTSALVEILTP